MMPNQDSVGVSKIRFSRLIQVVRTFWSNQLNYYSFLAK